MISYLQLEIGKCYCAYKNDILMSNTLVCEDDRHNITATMVCEEGMVCVGPSTSWDGIPMYKAKEMYENGTFCLKGL